MTNREKAVKLVEALIREDKQKPSETKAAKNTIFVSADLRDEISEWAKSGIKSVVDLDYDAIAKLLEIRQEDADLYPMFAIEFNDPALAEEARQKFETYEY